MVKTAPIEDKNFEPHESYHVGHEPATEKKNDNHHHEGCGHHHDHDDSGHWRRYIEHTSMHGVFQIQNSVSKAAKLIWTLIVLAAVSTLIYMTGWKIQSSGGFRL